MYYVTALALKLSGRTKIGKFGETPISYLLPCITCRHSKYCTLLYQSFFLFKTGAGHSGSFEYSAAYSDIDPYVRVITSNNERYTDLSSLEFLDSIFWARASSPPEVQCPFIGTTRTGTCRLSLPFVLNL